LEDSDEDNKVKNKQSKKKFGKEQIELVKNIYNKLKEQKQSMVIIQKELDKNGLQICKKTIKSIINDSY
jgi:IS30 family transposase